MNKTGTMETNNTGSVGKCEGENLLLHINGGLGKCIMATAVIRSYKQTNPESKIVVVSGYPEVFINNPDVYRFFPFNAPYLWKDYYGQPNWRVYAQDPYLNQSWIKNKDRHLIDVWCDELRIPSLQKTPLLFFSAPEVDELQAMIQTDKPLIVVQSTGGSLPNARSWTRNPPKQELEEFLGTFKESHFVLHLALPETPALQNVDQRIDNLDRRKAMALMYYANEVVGIDSYGLHARAANTQAGRSFFFLPLSESLEKIGYNTAGINYFLPKVEIQEKLKDHQDYYATVFRLGIENSSDNCPILAGEKWFDLSGAITHLKD